MKSVHYLLAQIDVDEEVLAGWAPMDSTTRELLIVFAALTLLTLLILIWAIFIRKPRRRRLRHHSHHRSYDWAGNPAPQNNGATPAKPPTRRKWRRRRREHRPRNPTLAETGGLPPVRTNLPPESLP